MNKPYAIKFPDGQVWEMDSKNEAQEYLDRNKGSELLEGKAASRAIHAGKVKRLKAYGIKPGARVGTVSTHVSASGMSRSIKVLMPGKDHEGKPTVHDVSWLVAEITGNKMDRERGGVIMQGCGMDMGFALVYELGACIWPKGTPRPHSTRNGEPDRDGGYALSHYWI